MRTPEKLEADRKANEYIDKQVAMLRSLIKPRPAPSPFIKINKERMEKTYTKKEVQQLIGDALEFAKEHDLDMEFEERANDHQICTNNWENLDKYEEFFEDLVNSFID